MSSTVTRQRFNGDLPHQLVMSDTPSPYDDGVDAGVHGGYAGSLPTTAPGIANRS